ncbi:hypothetical protein ACPBEI_07370 [Latilactobacillus sakei]
MNKRMYLSAMISIVLGLYIPKDMQDIAIIAIMSSIITFVGIKYKDFFPAKGSDDDE